MTDRELVTRIVRSGDEQAFEILYHRHAGAAYQFALRVTAGVRQDAEEVLQEAWLRAIARLEVFGWRSTFRTWLIGIALNVGREVLRRRTQTAGEDPIEPVEDHWPAAAAPRAQLDVEQALALLSDDLRLVALLHDVEGYTHNEIADRLGIAPGTSKSRLHRAHRRLRELLQTAEERRQTDE